MISRDLKNTLRYRGWQNISGVRSKQVWGRGRGEFSCIYTIFYTVQQGVTKKCRLSWLTNSALVYEPKCGGGGAFGVSANEHSAHGAQINFGDLTPCLTYAIN